MTRQRDPLDPCRAGQAAARPAGRSIRLPRPAARPRRRRRRAARLPARRAARSACSVRTTRAATLADDGDGLYSGPAQRLVPAPPGAPATALPPARALAGRRAGKRRPLCLRAVARRTRPLPVRRRQPPPTGLLPGRATDPSRRRGGRALRRLGAERRARLGGRRFQRLGRAPPPDAPALSSRRLGTVHPAPGRGRGLQVRGHRRQRRGAPEGRPARPPRRDCRPPPPRRPAWTNRATSPGPTRTGWPGARSARAMRHRCRSTKSTPAPGATATAGRRTGRNWPTSCRPTCASWASPTSN